MIPFITYREPDSNGLLCYYILQKQHPHYRAVIYTSIVENSLVSVPIAGYNMWLNFDGCLIGRFLPMYKNVIEEIQVVMNEMAIWFLSNRIASEHKKYEKFKIK